LARYAALVVDSAAVTWIVLGYVAGTFPSTWLVSRIHRSASLDAEVNRRAGETDAHLLAARHLGWGWSAVAAAADVAKGLLWVLAARQVGGQTDGVVAASGVAVVAGHAFPWYARDFAGRGLAAAAGVYLALLPVEMVIAAVLIVAGIVLRVGGVASTVALATVPIVAAFEGQPWPFVAMAVAIFVLVVLRRLQGVGDVIRAGTSPGRAIWYRAVFDTSGPPKGRRQDHPSQDPAEP
jgi:glycerol-3-phosphate acyltransferase PlsY